MSQPITTHQVNGANDQLRLVATGEVGAGGAHHRYLIDGFDTTNNPSREGPYDADAVQSHMVVLLQNGPIGEVGVNGVTHEVLLAIIKHRLEAFQRGPYACDDNAVALTAVDNAIAALQARTIARIARGVEGTHNV